MESPFLAFVVHSSGVYVVSITSSVGGSAARTATVNRKQESQLKSCILDGESRQLGNELIRLSPYKHKQSHISHISNLKFPIHNPTRNAIDDGESAASLRFVRELTTIHPIAFPKDFPHKKNSSQGREAKQVWMEALKRFARCTYDLILGQFPNGSA